MPRLPRVERESLSNKEDQDIHDLVVGGPGHDPKYQPGGPDGIYQIMMASPETAKRWHHLGRWLRRGAHTRDSDYGRDSADGPRNVVPPKLVEMVMCIVARDTNSQRMWHAHIGPARDLGLSNESAEILRTGGSLERLQADEVHVAKYCREMVRTHTVSDETFALVREQLGDRGLMELTALAAWWMGFSVISNTMKMTLMESSIMEGEPLMEVPPEYRSPPSPAELDRRLTRVAAQYQSRGLPKVAAKS